MDSDLEALCRSALDNLVSELQFTDGQKVLGTQDKETKRRAAVSKGHRNFTEKWDSLHPTACCVTSTTSFVRSARQTVYN